MSIPTITFYPVGGYTDMHLRPFVLNPSNAALGALKEATTPSALARVVGRCFGLSHLTEDVARIAQGWSSPRYSFELSFEYQATQYHSRFITVIGYTDTDDIYNPEGQISPDLRLNINAYFTGIKTAIQVGRKTEDCVRIAEPVGVVNAGHFSQRVFKLRPMDVFAAMSQPRDFGMFEVGGILDLRHMLTSSPSTFNRGNACAAIYLERAIKAYAQSLNDEMNYDLPSPAEAAHNRVSEPFFAQFPLFSVTGLASSTFTYGELREALDDLEVEVQSSTEVDQGWEFAPTDGSELETRIAVGLANIIATSLISCGLKGAVGYADTLTPDGAPEIAIDSYTPLQLPISTEAKVVDLEKFKEQLQTLVIPSLLPDSQSFVDITFTADITGDLTVTVGLNHGHPKHYRFPLFCDSLYNPMLTSRPETARELAATLETVLQIVTSIQE